MLKVLKSGFFTSIQDAGRFGYRDIGVPISGAMDMWTVGKLNMILENAEDAAAVVVHVQPVAHVLPVAVDRQRLARQGIEEKQRDELFRKLKRAVIIGAVRDQRREPIGVEVRPHEVVRTRLRGGVGTVGSIGRCFTESWILGT